MPKPLWSGSPCKFAVYLPASGLRSRFLPWTVPFSKRRRLLMPEAPFTLNTLLGLPDKDFCDSVVNAGGGKEEEAESTRGRISKALHSMQWKLIEGEIRRKAGELLEIDVLEMIVSAWRESKLLERLQNENRDKNGPAHVPLH